MIIRRERSRDFTILEREVFRDHRLSLEALGVLCFLRSCPDDWEVSTLHLRRRFSSGKDRVQRIIRELIETGWIVRHALRSAARGTFQGYSYIVRDEPSATIPPEPETPAPAPERAEPEPGFPAPDNPAPYMRTESNLELPPDPPVGGGPARARDPGFPERDSRRRARADLDPATGERFDRLVAAYPRDGVQLADSGLARTLFGRLGAGEQFQAIEAAAAYRELLQRRPDVPVKALHGWLRQGRFRNPGLLRGTALPPEAQPQAFLSRYSPHWPAADAAHRRRFGTPLPCFHEHRGNPGRWMALAELPEGHDPDPQDLRVSPAAIAAGAASSASRRF